MIKNIEEIKSLNEQGIKHLDQGNIELVIETYQKTLEMNPRDFEAFYNLGVCYTAKRDFGKAIEIDPEKRAARAWSALGIIYRQKEDKDNALKCGLKAVELNQTELYSGIIWEVYISALVNRIKR